MNNIPTITTLVLSGGGSKALTYIGVLKKLEELSEEKKIILNVTEICGVSAGSILGFLYILGYNSKELEKEVINKKFHQLKDISFASFLTYYGIDSGKNIMNWIESLILKKGYNKNITFKELFNKKKIVLKILSTNINKFKYTSFDNINTPDVCISKAIRCSISIPFYFFIEKYRGDIHIDGAIIDNYPINLYKDNLEGVLGIKTINYGEQLTHEVDNKINSIDSYIFHVIYCIIIRKESYTTLNENYQKHTIYICSPEQQSINFNLKSSEKQKLIDLGFLFCNKYFMDYYSIN